MNKLLAIAFILGLLTGCREMMSRADSSASSNQRKYSVGADAEFCTIKWGNSVKNNCNQAIRAHTTRGRVCTEGSMEIVAHGSGFLNCTDVTDIWVDRAVFTEP